MSAEVNLVDPTK